MKFFVDSILFSYAQIFFSNRQWLGFVVMAATFLVPTMGLVALLGVIVSNLAAYWLKFDEAKIRSGFYGFNGILFGAAAVFYFELSIFLLLLTALFIIITFFISAVLEHLLASMVNLPGLSLPFVVSLYVFIIFLTNFSAVVPHLSAVADGNLLIFLPEVIQEYCKSMAMILFQSNALAGVVFAISLLFLSRVMFILSIVGFSTAAITVSMLFAQPSESFTIVAGFNAILTAVALGGNLIIPSKKSLMLTVTSSVVVVILTGFFSKLLSSYTLPVLVLPFNSAVLAVLYSLKFRREQSDLVLLYFSPGTPEENYYYHHNRISRFQKFKSVVAELPFFGEWRVSQAHNGNVTHKDKWRYAWDFVVADERGKEFNASGVALSDFYCYKLPVVAPLDGTVARIVDGIPDNAVGETNLKSNWGNTVILDHGDGIYSSLSHLEPYSLRVKGGMRVKKGDILAACGNSGRSPTPHIHFQFQHTDKLGDKTVEYPIGHYIERQGDHRTLHSFDNPKQGMLVQNPSVHKAIKKALEFKLGDKFAFQCSFDKKTFTEEWDVKVDITNTMYIESTAGATATVTIIGNVFYLTHFYGNKHSALYCFYLTAVQVPLSYEPQLTWSDEYPLSKLLTNQIRYVSELFLIFKPQLRAVASFAFGEKTHEHHAFVISNNIAVEGAGLFRWYRRRWDGVLAIDNDGEIKDITVHLPNKKIFRATATKLEEESQ